MEIKLAGYNLDADIIERLKAKSGETGEDITPETISAAYARISRDPRPVTELRKIAREEVDRARKSNQAIIFKMGHHSVAEHAVFNFDIMGVSRLAIEEIEKFRLCSFTEKSQRYITLQGDYLVPNELKDESLIADFKKTIIKQNTFYFELFEKLKAYVFEENKDLASNPKNHTMLEGWAKEDARYITALATEGQLGLTVNARNLELMFRRFASSSLDEVKQLGLKMYSTVAHIAPSIILFTEANSYDQLTYPQLRQKASSLGINDIKVRGEAEVKLINFTPKADDMLVASLLQSSSGTSMPKIMKKVKTMTLKEKEEVVKAAMEHMQFYDSALREFEHVDLTYELIISAGAFGQLKRHRMATITSQAYDPNLGVTIPEAIIKLGMEKDFKKVVKASEKVYYNILKYNQTAAPYILTNSHRKRVLFKCNARELYHISRLREDKTTQWDIRYLTAKMTALAKEVMPLTMMLIGPKEKYPEKFREIFGKDPQVLPPS
ncbi:MAG: FAD-dependent thymidylate synthase [bacterium]